MTKFALDAKNSIAFEALTGSLAEHGICLSSLLPLQPLLVLESLVAPVSLVFDLKDAVDVEIRLLVAENIAAALPVDAALCQHRYVAGIEVRAFGTVGHVGKILLLIFLQQTIVRGVRGYHSSSILTSQR